MVAQTISSQVVQQYNDHKILVLRVGKGVGGCTIPQNCHAVPPEAVVVVVAAAAAGAGAGGEDGRQKETKKAKKGRGGSRGLLLPLLDYECIIIIIKSSQGTHQHSNYYSSLLGCFSTSSFFYLPHEVDSGGGGCTSG
jgi:hypothetical protein